MDEKKWKNCPKCGGFIPRNWERHGKCGWEGNGETGGETNPEVKETPKEESKAELNLELTGPSITVTRKETRQIRDFENNSYTVSITQPVKNVSREDIKELQQLVKEAIDEQKKSDGLEA